MIASRSDVNRLPPSSDCSLNTLPSTYLQWYRLFFVWFHKRTKASEDTNKITTMASWVIEELRKASRQEANRGSISDDVAGHNDPLLRLALSRVRGNSGIYGSSLSHVLSAPAERLTVASAPASPRLAQRHHDEALLLASQRLAENDLMMISRKIILDFPARLRAVLSIPRYSAVIAWMPHGYAWKIHDIDRFVREILPLFNMDVEIFLQAIEKWGFRQINGGPDRSAYYHEVSLCEYITIRYDVIDIRCFLTSYFLVVDVPSWPAESSAFDARAHRTQCAGRTCEIYAATTVHGEF